MDIPVTIIFLGLLIISTHFFNFLFKWTKLPTSLLLIIIGIIIGTALGFIQTDDMGKVGPLFTSITLIIILFTGGVNLKISELGRVFGRTILFSISNFLITAIISTAVVYIAAGFTNLLAALFLGCIVGGTSSAVVIPMLQQLKAGKDAETILTLESALTDVLCLIIGLAMLAAMQEGSIHIGNLFNNIGSSFLMAILLGFLSGFIWSMLLDKIRKIRNSHFINLAMAFVISGLADKMEWNSGIAALSFGLALSNAHLVRKFKLFRFFPSTELAEKEKDFFDEIAFVLQTFFFVYVGVAMKFGNIPVLLSGFVITFFILLVRPFVVRIFSKKNTPLSDLTVMTVMMPKGMVPAILASIPLQLGLPGGELLEGVAFSTVFASIFVCSILVMVLGKKPGRILYFKKILFKKSAEYNVAVTGQPSSSGIPEQQDDLSKGKPVD